MLVVDIKSHCLTVDFIILNMPAADSSETALSLCVVVSAVFILTSDNLLSHQLTS
jgi:hypothetical protein